MKLILDCAGPSVPIHCNHAKARTIVDKEVRLAVGQAGSEMPEQVQRIFAKAENEIPYEKQTGLRCEYVTAMDRRVWQSGISVVAADEQIEGSSGHPTFSLNVRKTLPSERASW